MKIAHCDFKVCGGSCLGELCSCAAFHGFRLCSAFLTCDVLLCAIFSTCRIKHVLFCSYGVPQGSILGPLLFLIYFSDICNATQPLPRLFADDACFIRNHSNFVSLNNALNVNLADVVKWCNANKLTINPNKCHCMVIPSNSKDARSNPTIKTNNSIIHSSQTIKYLGVIIDSKLSFAPHIKYIEFKLTRANGIISRIKSTLPKDALLKLYYALFQPHFIYGLTVWGTTYPTYSI